MIKVRRSPETEKLEEKFKVVRRPNGGEANNKPRREKNRKKSIKVFLSFKAAPSETEKGKFKSFEIISLGGNLRVINFEGERNRRMKRNSN